MKKRISKMVKKEFASFLENHHPQQFSSRLRNMVLDYIQHEIKAGTIPLYFNDFLWSLNDLFDLFDIAAKEFPQASSSLPLNQEG